MINSRPLAAPKDVPPLHRTEASQIWQQFTFTHTGFE